MVIMATVLLVLVMLALGLQCAAAWRYVRATDCPVRLAVRNRRQWPRAALIFSVRGDGRGLRERLEQCRSLEYPRFTIHIVVDHETDPNYPIARAWAQSRRSPPAVVHLLQDISPSSSLKCSSVRQCLQELDREAEVAVVVDADSQIYPLWLKDLMADVLESGSGIVSGNRWYDPTIKGTGALVRFIYNAHAVIPMQAMKMAWGGSLAIHRDVFASNMIPQLLWTAPTEDSAVHRIAQAVGMPFTMDPHVMLVGRDAITLWQCFDFIKRQLLWTRLYHEGWSGIMAGLLVSYAVLSMQTLYAAWAMWVGDATSAMLLGAGPAAAIAVNVVIIEALHRSVCSVVKSMQGIDVPRIGWSVRWGLIVCLPFAFVTIVLAALSAVVARRVQWSGIDYRILPPDGLQLVAYRPVGHTFGCQNA